MSGVLKKFGGVIRRWIARTCDAPQTYAQSTWAATLSVAETLLGLVSATLVTDIRRIKEANIGAIEAKTRKKQAEADLKTAEAQVKVAEAVTAANRATQRKQQEALARAEKARIAADTRKTNAEAEAILMDAESRQLQALADAQSRLLEALSQLRQEGGELFVSKENLEQMLRLRLPHHEE